MQGQCSLQHEMLVLAMQARSLTYTLRGLAQEGIRQEFSKSEVVIHLLEVLELKAYM